LVHSLDLTAEDNESDSYRDLLREIDRAFQSFDAMAVRHGWQSGGEIVPPPDPVAAGIDVAAFVAACLPADGTVPSAWARDLEGLPGYADGKIRLTLDPGRLRDAAGRTLAYPGRAHRLTQRVITATRAGNAARASAARGVLSLVASYVVETTGTVFRKVFALRLSPDGTMAPEDDLLAHREPVPTDGLWDRWFEGWVEFDRLRVRAVETGERLAQDFLTTHHARLRQADAVAAVWLDRRADELCGAVRAVTGDLFSSAPEAEAARDAFSRLSALAADASASAERRKEARQALACYRDRPRPEPSPPAIRALGLLLLVP
jgi:hypothetical protein